MMTRMLADRIDDFVGMTPATLDAEVCELELERRRIEAELAAALAVVDQRRDFKESGHRSMHRYVKATTNCSGGEATRLLRRASTINEHPGVGQELWAGRIGVAQADRLSRAAMHPRAGHRFGEFADQLIDNAEHLEWTAFDTVVRRFEVLADFEGAHADDERNRADRSATVVEGGGAAHVRADGGDALQAAEMVAIFRRAVQDEFERDCDARRKEHGDAAHDHPLPRTAQQRNFDAIYAIFMSYVTVPADGVRPKPLVNIVIDGATAGEALDDHGIVSTSQVFTDAEPDLTDRRCETSTGTVIHPDLALRAMLTARVRRVVIDSAGVIIDLGRERRLFTGKLRDAAQLLSTTCAMNGCEVPAEYCDVDHLDEYAHGGHTSQANAAPMCGPDNREKHRRKLRARRAADGRPRLIRPDGSVIKPAGERDPRWAHHEPGDLTRTVLWDEWIWNRPKLHGVPDLGWRIHVVDGDLLPRR